MRLIDADALIEKLQRNSAFGMVRNAADKNVYEIIAEQPTAYDVEKVVEELDKAESVKTFGSLNSGNRLIPVKDAINIVKAGGVE